MRLALAAATVVAGLGLAACGSSSGAGSGYGAGGTPAGTATAGITSPAGTVGAAPTSGTPLGITATEFHLTLSAPSVPAGTYTLTVHNGGSERHAVTVDGGGLDESTGGIAPGATTTMTLRLAAGSYDVFCPIGNHRSRGMQTTLVVT